MEEEKSRQQELQCLEPLAKGVVGVLCLRFGCSMRRIQGRIVCSFGRVNSCRISEKTTIWAPKSTVDEKQMYTWSPKH